MATVSTRKKPHSKIPYVTRKIMHMQRMGIAAGVGSTGGACPDWLKDKLKEEADRASQSR